MNAKTLSSICLGVLLLLFSQASCHQNQPNQASTLKTSAPCANQKCFHSISNLSEFMEHSGEVEVSGSVQHVMKIVYIRDDRQALKGLYFFNAETYPFHLDFVWSVLGINVSLQEFNKDYTGSGDTRKYNMGSLILFETPEKNGQIKQRMLLEMWNGDQIEGPWLKEFYDQVIAKLNLKVLPDFYFHPLSLHQSAAAKDQALGIRSISSEELFAGRSYMSLNGGESKGYITLVRNSGDANVEAPCLDLTKIAVFDRVPNELGLVAGVITGEFQTPLSHVNVKSVNRGTVNMVLIDALKELEKYDGKAVSLKVNAFNYEIRLLDPKTADQEIARFWQDKKPHLDMNPQVILGGPDKDRFIDLSTYFNATSGTIPGQHGGRIPEVARYKNLMKTIGAKATNLGALKVVLSTAPFISDVGISSPSALGVPFDFYERFMNYKQKELDLTAPEVETTPALMIQKILDQNKLLSTDIEHPICQIRPVLAEIREIITRSKVPQPMLDEFKKYLKEDESSPIHQTKVPRIRLRSSTNSEDLQGFTGAGLYNSDGVSLYKKLDDGSFDRQKPLKWEDIEKKLRKVIPYVYSSVWNDRAFEEREWFGINGKKHLAIKVGIAVHSAFSQKIFDGEEGEVANGVAVSRNIFDENRHSQVYINGQHYDLAITNPPTAEELIAVGEDPSKPYLTEQILTTTMLADDFMDTKPDAWKYWTFEYLGTSSVKGGEMVLKDNPMTLNQNSEMEIRRLTKVIKHVSDSFAELNGVSEEEFAIDIEWKVFSAARNIEIKQARPFVYNTQKLNMAGIVEDQQQALAPSLKVDRKKTFGYGPKRSK